MKRLLVLAALSLAGLAETAAQAPAWWPCHKCDSSCCNVYKVKVKCKQYNAFSPCCNVNVYGNFCCAPGCGQPWGGSAGCAGQYAAPTWDYGAGCNDCARSELPASPVQPFCACPPFPFPAPASFAAACGASKDCGGHCGFWKRLHRRVAVEPPPNGCNACCPTFTENCANCEEPTKHHHKRRGSWWARFTRQQLCCTPDSCGITEYTCCGCDSAPAAAPARAVAPAPAPVPTPPPAAPSKELPTAGNAPADAVPSLNFNLNLEPALGTFGDSLRIAPLPGSN